VAHTVHHLTVPRTARYLVAGEEQGASEVWIVLHGYSQLAASLIRWFEPALRPGRLVVAPEALSRAYFDEAKARRVGASWMTREDREAEIHDYVRYLDLLVDEVLGIAPTRPRLEVHGFSQGCATASRWVAFGRHRVDRMVLWGGTTPPDLDPERLRLGLLGAPVTMVLGDRDRFLTVEQMRADQARLEAAGLPVDTQVFAGGHLVDPTVLAALA